MKTILAVVGDGNAGPVLETAVLAAKRFGSRITGLNALGQRIRRGVRRRDGLLDLLRGRPHPRARGP